jgi:hypothetical protein
MPGFLLLPWGFYFGLLPFALGLFGVGGFWKEKD